MGVGLYIHIPFARVNVCIVIFVLTVVRKR